MDPALKAKWVEALRSGEHKQCKNALHADGGYCCLGVLTVVAGYQIDTRRDRVLRPGNNPDDTSSNEGYRALADFGLTDRIPLINMNDEGKSFSEIADFIEANL